MMKSLTNLLIFIIPLTITYAIISDFGKPGNHYGSPDNAGVSHQGLPQHNGN